MNEPSQLIKLLRTQAIELQLDNVAYLFSGGLDSSLIASIFLPFNKGRLYCIGMSGSNDVIAAEKVAVEIGAYLEIVEAKEEEIVEAAEKVMVLIERSMKREPSYVEVSIYTPLYLLLSKIKEEVVISGQGADELFGGYHRYLSMNAEMRAYEMEMDIEFLRREGIKRDIAIANEFRKKLITPYLSEEIVKFALTLPPEWKIKGDVRKFILRECARQLSLSTAEREKKAIQYGSGFEKVLRRHGFIDRMKNVSEGP